MAEKPVVVVGAGPAGVAAALGASRNAPTILLDEQPEPGGHLRWTRGHGDTASPEEILAGGIDYRSGTSVWALFDDPVVAAYDAGRAFSIDASAVVVATGAVDRVWPIPGWHLAGVTTPGKVLGEGRIAATTRFGIIGGGPEAEVIVAAIEAAGGTIEHHATDLATTRIDGATRVEALRDQASSAAVERIVLALERRPNPSLALAARATSAFDRDALVELPLLDACGATSLPGVYVAGEAAGITSVDAVREHGTRAGHAAAQGASPGPLVSPSGAPSPALPLPDDPTTIVCRHQMVDLATVQEAIERGAYDVNDVRRQTRAGMGPDGAQETLPMLAALMLRHDPSIPDERLIGRQRPPVRPLPFRSVLDAAAD